MRGVENLEAFVATVPFTRLLQILAIYNILDYDILVEVEKLTFVRACH